MPDSANPTTAPPANDLPDGVVLVTVQIPVYIGDFPGNDGGQGRIDGQLRRGPAQACQRVLLAQQQIADARLGDHVPPRYMQRLETVRYVFAAIQHAIEAQTGD